MYDCKIEKSNENNGYPTFFLNTLLKNKIRTRKIVMHLKNFKWEPFIINVSHYNQRHNYTLKCLC